MLLLAAPIVLVAVASVRAAGAAAATYSMAVTEYPARPWVSWTATPPTTAWQFNYNPAFLPGGGPTPAGLYVRVQNGTELPPGQCGEPASTSYLAFAPLVQPCALGSACAVGSVSATVQFAPSNTSWEQDAEDPRIVYVNETKTWWMTYTANGVRGDTPGSKPPLNRHQGIASSVHPLEPGSWTRHCSLGRDCLPDGLKSGAMLLRPFPGPHYMFVYDLRKGCPNNPGGVCRETAIATSYDMQSWTPLNKTLLHRRPNQWDAGLIEPGPPPLRLSNGDCELPAVALPAASLCPASLQLY
jgi:hypothetical protein